MDNQPASGNSSDREGDTFEDAAESTPRPASQERSTSGSRSLIRSSSSSTAKESQSDSPVPELPNGPESRAKEGHTAPKQKEDNAGLEKSPLLTAHRVSVSSDMDDVSLDEDGAKASSRRPTPPPRDSTGNTGFQRSPGNMSPVNLPPPPPPVVEKHASLPTPAPVTRKLTSPFSWLSRSTASKKAESPPPPSDRRNTNASVTTISSNPELSVSKIDDDGEQGQNNRSSQTSLRDRFKFLRMREEAGIAMTDEAGAEQGVGSTLAGLLGRTSGLGLSISSPKSVADEPDEDAAGVTSDPTNPRPSSLSKHATVNPSLAPGTASGIAAGPAGDAAEPVDWDLWQAVVNEGPAAVARTSPEELNRAIASGIPQAIRGVIWQVLAQSKNDELEGVYRELVARRTDKDQTKVGAPGIAGSQTGTPVMASNQTGPPSLTRPEPSAPVNGNGKEKESVASSASSIHSDYSTPATTNGSTAAPLASPPIGTEGTEDMAKVQAKLVTDQKKKAKDDAAALQKLEKQIKRDLGTRTSYSKYLMAAGLQDGLFGVCKAYALYDEAIGYAQGMNFIAMPLLFNMPEEEAFSLFVTLMNKYGLRDMFVPDMHGLHLHLYQFERLLEDLEPALYCHLHRREVKPQLYATQWFLTLFAYRFPLQLVLRIYDLILSEGLEGAILKFGIVLMQKNAEVLLGMKDMVALTTFLKERLFDVYIDKAPSASSILESGFFGSAGGADKEVYRADMLVKDAVAVKVTPEMLKQYTVEWKEHQRVEKERETELHSLKDKVGALETKVRQLERRAEQSDTEHVQVASELVKTKVENESLAEENETLKTKVQELQKIVDTQPEEVEAKLKSEMESVMQKNIVVHNENRALEEQMAEMEKELVAAKLQWATMNEDHEALKRKWNNISQMMNK